MVQRSSIVLCIAALAASASASNWVGLPVPSRGETKWAPYDTRSATVYIQSWSETESSTHPAPHTTCTAHWGLTKTWTTTYDTLMTYAYADGNNDVWSLTVTAPAGISWMEFSFFCTFNGTQVWWDGSGSNAIVQVTDYDNITCNTHSSGATSAISCSGNSSCYADYIDCATNPSLCDSDEVSAGLHKWVYGCQASCSSKVGNNGTCCQANYCNSLQKETCFVGSSSTEAQCSAGESCAIYASGSSAVYGCASAALCANISSQSLGKCCDADLCNTIPSSQIDDENVTSSSSPAEVVSSSPLAVSSSPAAQSSTKTAASSHTAASTTSTATSSIVTPLSSSSHVNGGFAVAPVAVAVALFAAVAASL